MQRRNVLLPHPLGPSRHTKRPDGIVAFRSCKTSNRSLPIENDFPRFRASMSIRLPPVIAVLALPWPKIFTQPTWQVRQLDLEDLTNDRIVLFAKFGKCGGDELLCRFNPVRLDHLLGIGH